MNLLIGPQHPPDEEDVWEVVFHQQDSVGSGQEKLLCIRLSTPYS